VTEYIVLGVFVGFTTLIVVQFAIFRMGHSRRVKFSAATLALQTLFCAALAVIAPNARTRIFALVLVAAGAAATARTWSQRNKIPVRKEQR
jgi:hypothetical protein